MRMPAYPLWVNDPYMSIWSFADKLNEKNTVHWTGIENRTAGTAVIDGKAYCFMGEVENTEKAEQLSVEYTALSTIYTFKLGDENLKVKFTSPLLIDDIKQLSTPVSYICIQTDSKKEISVKIALSEQLCLAEKGQYEVVIKNEDCKYPTASMGAEKQNILNRCGDGITIDYGYLYISASDGKVDSFKDDMSWITAETVVKNGKNGLITVAYDDIYSIEYFGEKLKSLWNSDGTSILTAIENRIENYDSILSRCDAFDKQLYADALESGGKMYAELLSGAYRQLMAAHKIAVDKNGEILWISKECFSNGCAATVDVTYPSAPIFMLYNTELLKGMLRPVFKYAESDKWEFDFAPHDCGTYPLVNGQTYYENKIEYQMPIEECGNMLVLASAVALLDKNTEFVSRHKTCLYKWAEYLCECGFDPKNQLCTDDFSGHLAHNCNLSLKAICALKAFSRVCTLFGDNENARKYSDSAEKMAKSWAKEAKNADGTTKLAFDQDGTYSMKYNLIWDKVFGLDLFDNSIAQKECETYEKNSEKYGIPLDNRAKYTKSDWLVWCAALNDTKEGFEKAIEPLWNFYNESPSRVPMTDWYNADEGTQKGFQNRTVQGGLWIKMLMDKNKFKRCKQ